MRTFLCNAPIQLLAKSLYLTMALPDGNADATGCVTPTVLLPISHERLSNEVFTPEDDFNRDYDYPYHSFSEQKISLANVQDYLRWKNPMEVPTQQKISAVTTEMVELQDTIRKKGTTRIRNQVFQLAKKEEMLDKDNRSVVVDFDQVRDSFRQTPSFHKCRILFGILHTWTQSEEGKQWFKETMEAIEAECKIVYGVAPPEDKLGTCFVGRIITKKALANVRSIFKENAAKGVTIGLTAKKSTTHPMGPPLAHQGNKFQPQNINGWDDLVQVCEVARSLHDAYHLRQGGPVFHLASQA